MTHVLRIGAEGPLLTIALPDDYTIVVLCQVTDYFFEELTPDITTLLVDCSHLNYIDSMGGELFSLHFLSKRSDTLAVFCAAGKCEWVIKLLGKDIDGEHLYFDTLEEGQQYTANRLQG